MRSQRISFPNRNGLTISARLEMPVGEKPYACALFAHCFTCSKNLNAVRHISRGLTMNGIAVLRFDFTGLGESEGDFADTNFSSNVSDLLDAAEFLQRELEAPSLLIGHSLGGAAVLMAATQNEPVFAGLRGVVTVGTPSDPSHVLHHLNPEDLDRIQAEGDAEVILAGRPFRIKAQFLKDLNEQTLTNRLKNLRVPLLFMHSPIDATVSIEHARKLYDSALHPKSFLSLDQADHLLTRSEDAQYVGDIVAGWSRRYCPKPKLPRLETEHQVVARTDIEAWLTDVQADAHRFLADEPTSAGGEDAGPSPYDFLITALGTCTSMTIRYYADLKKWPLQEVRTHLSFRRDHTQDASSTSGHLETIERHLELIGDLSDEQRDKLTQIAERCPVHRTLHGDLRITTGLLPRGEGRTQ